MGGDRYSSRVDETDPKYLGPPPSRWRPAEALSLTAVIGLLYVWLARFGVDPHHDGMVVQPAFVVADGGVVHRDVFEQYGAVTAWYHGAAVRMFGRTLLVIRVSSALLLASAIGLLFGAWRSLYGRGIAYVGVLSAIASSYFFVPGLDMRAWSSDTLIFLQALCIWLLCVKEEKTLTYVLVGFLTGAAVFSRIGPGIAQVVLMTVILILTRRKKLLKFVTGFATSVLLIVGYLWANTAIDAWWYQTVVMPFEWARGLPGSHPFPFVLSVVKMHVVPFVIVPIALVWSLSHVLARKTSNLWRVTVFASGALMVLNLAPFKMPSFTDRGELPWAVLVLTGIGILKGMRGLSDLHVDWNHFTIALVVPVAALSQIYPVVESRHLWWATVPAFGFAFSVCRQMMKSIRLVRGVTLVFVASIVASAVIDLGRNLSVKRVRVTNNEILESMYFDASYYRYFEANLDSLEAYTRAHPGTPIINMCADGLFQSLTGNSDMPDPYYVLWAFRSEDISFEQRAEWAIARRPMAWFCPPSPDETAQAGLFGLRVIPLDSATKALPRQREWPFMSALAVPVEWPIPEGATG